ncbi:hypothetical protein Plhal304r1_c057g0144151 [Plasmopara halstedii]
MAHSDKKCRSCGCRNKVCRRRRTEQRRQLQHLNGFAQFLYAPRTSAYRRWLSKDWENEIRPDVVLIDSRDIQDMRNSVDRMQRQLSQGLRDIQEIRTLVKQVVARDRYMSRLRTDVRESIYDTIPRC